MNNPATAVAANETGTVNLSLAVAGETWRIVQPPRGPITYRRWRGRRYAVSIASSNR